MKKLYSTTLYLICLILISQTGFTWNADLLVHDGMPAATHSMGAKADGTLYICVPVDSGNGVWAIITYQSIDNGDTWNVISFPNAVSASPILKTKIVTSGSDSIFCLYQTAFQVQILNLESGIIGVSIATGVDDFDAAASPNGNAIYLFVNEVANFDIRRFGTLDGGLTWTGNTALVTGAGFAPKVYMTGTRLILNYYGPVLADTVSSIIRAAFYDEGTPGIITPGTFQDVMTNTAVKKKEFSSVINDNVVWFFYTEGDNQQVLNCRFSNDFGVTYSAPFTIGGSVTANAYKYDAKHYSDLAGAGCAITFFSDSILFPPPFDIMVMAVATSSNPSQFTGFGPFSDFTITTSPGYHKPVVIPFFSVVSPSDFGVAWVEEGTTGISVYFDRFLAVTSIIEQSIYETAWLEIFPNPVQDQVMLSFEIQRAGVATIFLYNSMGELAEKLDYSLTSGIQSVEIDIRHLKAGVYTVWLEAGNETAAKKLVLF